MHIMYIDESGDTIPINQKGKRFLILCDCIIHESDYQTIEKKLRQIKQQYFKDSSIEIKSNYLRYANPDIDINSPLKVSTRKIYDSLEESVSTFLKTIPVDLYAIAIDKKQFWHDKPTSNPYDTAYMLLLQRFQTYLKNNNSLGIVVIDPREGQVEKHFIGNELAIIHERLRWSDGKIWNQCPNIIEKLLFSQSDTTTGIQIADLYCYPIFHVFEYNKTKTDYWRFSEISNPKLSRAGSRLDKVGLTFIPDRTKKDQRYYT